MSYEFIRVLNSVEQSCENWDSSFILFWHVGKKEGVVSAERLLEIQHATIRLLIRQIYKIS